MVYEMASRLCTRSSEDAFLSNLLDSSTLVLIPEALHSQLNCHDYLSIVPFEPVIDLVINRFPRIDYVILLATGGLKVRFINSMKTKRAEDLAVTFASHHSLMTANGTELCRLACLLDK